MYHLPVSKYIHMDSWDIIFDNKLLFLECNDSNSLIIKSHSDAHEVDFNVDAAAIELARIVLDDTTEFSGEVVYSNDGK